MILPDIAKNLKWIQCTSAGIGQFVRSKGYAEKTDWIFTTASGVHIRPLAEFVIMSMLMFVKDFFLVQQQARGPGLETIPQTSFQNTPWGIVGLGKIGREIARIAKTFDMRVVGTRRNPTGTLANVDEVYPPSELPLVLKQSNFLCLTTPHTDETTNLISEKMQFLLPKNTILINISRGVS